MTMAEGVVRHDALRVRDGQLTLAVGLPWYRSLPLSCLESVDVAVAGAPVAIRSVAVPGFSGPIDAAAGSDATWDLRDRLDVTLGTEAERGAVVALEVTVAVRIPYIQQAPGVPLVQRAVVRTEATIR